LSGYAGDARDIIERTHGEEARPINETAYQLLRAALIADQNTAALRQLAAQTRDATLTAAVETRSALRAKVAAQYGAPAADPSPLGDVLARTQRACEASGARLFVVALPLDVQVSQAEWQKYGQKPIDLGPTRVLIDDVTARARAAGARALDATPALAAAEPGAFLNHDLHMSAKGHAALARAIASALRTPDTTRAPLPPGRSLPPLWDELAAIRPLPAPDLTAIACELRRVREWVDIECGREGYDDLVASSLSGIELLSGGRGDAIVAGGSDWASRAVFPLLEGDQVQLRLFWSDTSRVLHVQRPPRDRLSIWLGPIEHGAAVQGARPQSIAAEDGPGGYDRTCMERKGSEPCLLGSGRWVCDPGEMQFGVLRRCVPRCSPAEPCKRGRCALFQSERGCIEP
jgi:hypothetical protein